MQHFGLLGNMDLGANRLETNFVIENFSSDGGKQKTNHCR